ARGDAHALGRALLVGHVDLRGREVPHQDHGQRGRRARPRAQGDDALAHAVQHRVGDLLAVQEHAARARRWIEAARLVSGPTPMTSPRRAAGPLAGSKRIGIWVRKRWMMMSLSTPMTESTGPVMPRSVM